MRIICLCTAANSSLRPLLNETPQRCPTLLPALAAAPKRWPSEARALRGTPSACASILIPSPCAPSYAPVQPVFVGYNSTCSTGFNATTLKQDLKALWGTDPWLLCNPS